jgi:hypothetical protein
VGKHTRTPRGRRRREAAFEQRATHHHEFIGEADPERAEAEFRKHERLETEAVREMASQFERLSGAHDGAIGPEIPFRIPRSIDEAKDTMEKLRDKAEERLEEMPETVQRAIHLGESVLGLMLVPVRFGVRLVRDVLAVPAAMLRILTRQEA